MKQSSTAMPRRKNLLRYAPSAMPCARSLTRCGTRRRGRSRRACAQSGALSSRAPEVWYAKPGARGLPRIDVLEPTRESGSAMAVGRVRRRIEARTDNRHDRNRKNGDHHEQWREHPGVALPEILFTQGGKL